MTGRPEIHLGLFGDPVWPHGATLVAAIATAAWIAVGFALAAKMARRA